MTNNEGKLEDFLDTLKQGDIIQVVPTEEVKRNLLSDIYHFISDERDERKLFLTRSEADVGNINHPSESYQACYVPYDAFSKIRTLNPATEYLP